MKVAKPEELVLWCSSLIFLLDLQLLVLLLLTPVREADSTPSCNNNEVRLVGGSGEWEGNVQICYNGKWGAVCDNGWGSPEAQVVCRQLLGYSAPSTAGYQYRLQSYYGYQGAEPAVLGFVDCTGTEEQLSDCIASWSTEGSQLGSCNPSNMAGVYCGYNKTCTNGTARLTNDQSGVLTIGRSEGRVEVCYENSWKTMCSKLGGWSKTDAELICKHLGFNGTDVEPLPNGEDQYGPGFHPHIQLSNNSDTTALCSNNKDIAAVRCYTNTEDRSCSWPNDNVRLYNAFIDDITDNHEGILQTCINGEWHTVCHDSATEELSNAVCILLGFKGAIGYRLNAGLYYGYTQYYDNHTCIIANLSECTPAPSSCGYYNKTMGIICYNYNRTLIEVALYDHCQDGDLRLMNSTVNMNNGTLEICYSNTWGLVSAGNWNKHNTDVACRDLGYETGGVSYSVGHSVYNNRTIHLHNVTCNGTEQNLISCNLTLIPALYESATVVTRTVYQYSLYPVIGLVCGLDDEHMETKPRVSSVGVIVGSTLSAIVVIISSVFLISLLVYVVAVRYTGMKHKQTSPPDGGTDPLCPPQDADYDEILSGDILY